MSAVTGSGAAVAAAEGTHGLGHLALPRRRDGGRPGRAAPWRAQAVQYIAEMAPRHARSGPRGPLDQPGVRHQDQHDVLVTVVLELIDRAQARGDLREDFSHED